MDKTMKKIAKTACLAALSLMFSAVPVFADAETSFSDIKDAKYSWAVGYIEDMTEQGFIKGYEDGTFRPDKSVTRLEVLSLFARAMGSNSEANSDALKHAEEQYLDVVKGYDLNFGESDIAYLLYRGALKESELSTYLKGDLKNEPMPRYEAAIIITKALCAEKAATSEIMVDLSYADAKSIPDKASQYVYYVTKQKIMQGMGKNKNGEDVFSPDSSVLRSQIAVMLSKTVDLMNLTVENFKLTDIGTANVSFYDYETDLTDEMGYNSNTRFYVMGELTQAKNVKTGVDASFTYVGNELVYVDIENDIPDESVSGIFQSYSSSNGVVTVTVRVDGEDKQYNFASKVDVEFNGQSATIRDFSKSDAVTLELSGGKIKSMKGEPKDKTIANATVEEISIVDDGTMTISHALEDYDGLKLKVDSNVKVTKNDAPASLADVYKGDTVRLTLSYGVVTEIVATSSTRVVEGVIKSMEISASPKITVTVKGTDTTYDITSGISIIINNKESTIYDLRVGDNISITIESQAVKKITATSSSSIAYSKKGVITAINAAYGFIKISYNENDVTYEETVYCKDSSTKFITSEGTNKVLKDLKTGDVVSVRGTMTNGAFEASLILIEAEN